MVLKYTLYKKCKKIKNILVWFYICKIMHVAFEVLFKHIYKFWLKYVSVHLPI